MSRAAVIGIAVGLAAATGILAIYSIADAGARAEVVTLGPLDEPSAIAAAPGGAIFVAEAGASRVSVFDREGRLVRRWGRPGGGPGELRRPRGIAVASDGRVYVADTGNHRIAVFSEAGVPETSWGGFGTAPGRFIEPLGVAVEAGRVYVADARNNRVQIFDRSGILQLYVWSYGVREAQLDRPVDVAVGDDGAFYVSDQGNSRIQKFDAEGTFLSAWGGWGPHPGLFAEPGGIALERGKLLVADTHNHRVQVLGSSGAFEGVWDEDALGRAGASSPPPSPIDVTPLPQGEGLAYCDADRDLCRIVTRGPEAPRPGRLSPTTATSRAAALSGTTLVVAAGGAGFLALDVAGVRPVVLGAFGGFGREALQFVRPAGVAIDPGRERVLVSDPGNYRLAWLDLRRASEGPARYDPARTRFVRSIFFGDEEALLFGPIKWTPVPSLLEPGAIARDARGTTFVLDTLFGRVVVFDEGFRPIASWGAHEDGEGAFLEPVDLALAPSGKTLYVLDAASGRIQAFDREGKRLFGWGRSGDRRDGLGRPVSLGAAGDGTILVADRTGRIRRFTNRGAPLGVWGRPGTEAGALHHPEKVLADGSGRAFVLDDGGRRLQAFTRDGRFLWELDVIEAAIEARRARGALLARATAAGRVGETAAGRVTNAGTMPVPASSGASDGESVPKEGCPHRALSNAGAWIVCWSPSVDPIPHNAPFSLDVRVYDAARPAAVADLVALTVDASMPEHGHGLVQLPVVRATGKAIPRERLPDHALTHGAAVGEGRFEVQELRLHMPGRWELYFDVGRGAVIERTQVEILLD